MIHGYSRAMFFQTASQRIKQNGLIHDQSKTRWKSHGDGPLLACTDFIQLLFVDRRHVEQNTKLSVPTAFQPTSSVIGIWILATWRKTYFAGKHRITYPLHSPALLSGWILPNFPNMDQWNDVSSCFDVFPFFLPRCGGRGSCGFGGRSAVWRTGGTWTDEGGHWMDVEVCENP